MSGTLYLCATPIGNLEDITLRVLRILREADIIAAEDTRHTRKLLNHFEITTPLTSYHEHNSRAKGEHLLDILRSGRSVALVTDAGMPAVSDPGADIVRLCHEHGLPVTCAPGASAHSAALAVSGLGGGEFIFGGFLPRGTKERRQRIADLADEHRTVIFYEAPHRLRETLQDLAAGLQANRKAAIVSELTKMYEKCVIGNLPEISETAAQTELRGEFVIVLGGASKQDLQDRERAQYSGMSAAEHVEAYIQTGLDPKAAMKAAARDRGVSKSVIYKEMLS
ncbi:MAG: 16S rRNA (cytidine(1402)-2'-O)-methyltransferase [Defluviitaleaceae bacterium]|nr:16S rRNA (cytidine(1402)-2'-O)-methyltransferase [Defluviitaleaceae bacterium]